MNSLLGEQWLSAGRAVSDERERENDRFVLALDAGTGEEEMERLIQATSSIKAISDF